MNRNTFLKYIAGALICTSYIFGHEESFKNQNSLTQYTAIEPYFPWGINPQHPKESTTFDFLVGASYTYWLPYQNGMILAYNLGDSTDLSIFGKNIVPNFEGQSGFKVHLGMITPHDGWGVFANYTWFYNVPNFAMHTLEGTLAWNSRYFSGGYEVALTRFANQFNRIDTYMDRNFYIGKYSILRPWLGLLGAFDYQYLHINTEDLVSSDVNYFAAQQNWWGIGPYAGFESSYLFGKGFGIYIDLGAALLLADHYVYELSTHIPGVGSPSYPLHQRSTSYDVEPMIETNLGISLDYSLDKVALLGKIGWEMQTYFYHNGFTPLDPLGNKGGYSMQGLTATLGLYF